MNEVLSYILGFKPYVLLPIIMLILSLVFRMDFKKALISSVTIGIGFIGIFIMLDYFVAQIEPAVKALVSRTGLHFNALDVGWPPLAAIAWSYKLTPLLFLIILAVNVLMLVFKLTNTVNVDIWNFWHFIFGGILVSEATGNIYMAIGATVFMEVVMLKLSDWCVVHLDKFSVPDGVTITTTSGLTYFPVGIVANKLFDRIPGIKNLDASPEAIRKKIGIFGETIVIGLLIGLGLGIGAGYQFKQLLELAFGVTAVIYLFPLMTGVLSKGLMPLSDGMKDFIRKNLPSLKNTRIGLDQAIIFGNESIIVSYVILIPIAILLAFILPGMKFVPLGDLTMIFGHIAMLAVALRGNVVRILIMGVPILAVKLLISNQLVDIFTKLSNAASVTKLGEGSKITSAFDGGNPLRFWLMKLSEGNIVAIVFVPVILGVLYLTYREFKIKSAEKALSEN